LELETAKLKTTALRGNIHAPLRALACGFIDVLGCCGFKLQLKYSTVGGNRFATIYSPSAVSSPA